VTTCGSAWNIKEDIMANYRRLGLLCAALVVTVTANTWAQAGAAAAAVKASPALIEALSKEIGSSPEQAAGAAGALFGLAKSRLSADEFSQVASAVPGIDALLSAAPAMGGESAV
jgi:hypothetical protein